MGKLFEKEILNNWGGFKVLANVEETTDNANLAIQYDDHGDEFIFVRTKDGRIFEYGLYVTRKCEPDMSELELSCYKDYFIRKPTMYYEWDNRSSLAYEIYSEVRCRIKERDTRFGGYSDNYKKEYSESYAKFNFEKIIEYMNEQRAKGIRFDQNNRKSEIAEYLKINNIYTDENAKILKETKFDMLIDGADGIAGKRELTSWGISTVHGDCISRIIINGKEKDPARISMKHYYDDDMCDRVVLSINQFR